MNDFDLSLQLDAGIARLAAGAPFDEVLRSVDASLEPFLAVFAILQKTVAQEARREFRMTLRARLMRQAAPEPGHFRGALRRAAGFAGAALLLGSAVSPALARELLVQLRETLGEPVAALLEDALVEANVLDATVAGTSEEASTAAPAGGAALLSPTVPAYAAPASPVPGKTGRAPREAQPPGPAAVYIVASETPGALAAPAQTPAGPGKAPVATGPSASAESQAAPLVTTAAPDTTSEPPAAPPAAAQSPAVASTAGEKNEKPESPGKAAGPKGEKPGPPGHAGAGASAEAAGAGGPSATAMSNANGHAAALDEAGSDDSEEPGRGNANNAGKPETKPSSSSHE